MDTQTTPIHEVLGITAEAAHELILAVHRQNPYSAPSEPFDRVLGADGPRVFALVQGHGDRWERLARLITLDDLKCDEPSTRAGIEACIATLDKEIEKLEADLAAMSPEATGPRWYAEHAKDMREIERRNLANRLKRELYIA